MIEKKWKGLGDKNRFGTAATPGCDMLGRRPQVTGKNKIKTLGYRSQATGKNKSKTFHH